MRAYIKQKRIQAIIRTPFKTPDFLGKTYFASLDGWRAVAIILVILGHAKLTKNVTPSIYYFLETFVYAELGVKIFFVLSGFLITTLLIKEYGKNGTIDLKAFYVRRTLRIFPVLYLYLVVLYVVDIGLGLDLTWNNFAGPALYITNFNFFQTTWLTGHSWSLAVEEQFYIVWPLVFLFNTKKSWSLCLLIITSVPFFRILWYVRPDWYQITLGPFIGNIDSLMTGCLVSILCFKGAFHSKQRVWTSTAITLLAICLIFLCYFFSKRGMFGLFLLPMGDLVSNIAIAYLVVKSLIVQDSKIKNFLTTPSVRYIGVLSYSLYIWQQLFLVPTNGYQSKIIWSLFPYNIILLFITAYVSYNYFESYFLKIKSRFSAKSTTPIRNRYEKVYHSQMSQSFKEVSEERV